MTPHYEWEPRGWAATLHKIAVGIWFAVLIGLAIYIVGVAIDAVRSANACEALVVVTERGPVCTLACPVPGPIHWTYADPKRGVWVDEDGDRLAVRDAGQPRGWVTVIEQENEQCVYSMGPEVVVLGGAQPEKEGLY